MQLIVQKRGYRWLPVLVLALLALGLTAVFAHGDPATENADNHIGTDCDAVGSPGPPCASSVEKVAGVEVDADLTAGDAEGTAIETHCGESIDSHGGPAGSDGKDWDDCPRVSGDAANALINLNGAAPPAQCPPVLSPQPAGPTSQFWNQGPGILICDRSAYMSDNDEKDDVFTGGSKTTEEKQWQVATPGAPRKGDLDNAGFFRGKGISGDTAGDVGDDWIVGFISKTDTDGDSHNFFELRQALCSTDLSAIASCPRTTGDVLVIVDTSSVDNKITITVFEWFEFGDFPASPPCPALSSSLSPTCKGDGIDETASVADDCVIPSGDFAAKTNGCWDPIPASHPTVIGVFNFDGVSATGGGVPPENADDEVLAGPWGAFGCERTTDDTSTGCKSRTHHAGRELLEFAVNLSDLGISPECPGFGTLLGGGRSSSSLDAELKDALPAVNLPLECSLSWEKRDGSTADANGVHPLQGGATFTVDGDNNNNGDGVVGGDGLFRCLDADTTNDVFGSGTTVGDESDPITVVDDNDGPDFANGDFDADADLGQISIPSVCFGTYTITETVAPTGYAKDADVTRVVTIDSNNINAVVGTQGTDDHDGTGTGIADCIPPSAGDECDFHNRLGTIEWEKRDESTSTAGVHPLQGGATFKISPDPSDGVGEMTGITDCVVGGTVLNCNAFLDKDSDAGQFKIERVLLLNVAPCYTVTETAAPAGYAIDDDPDRANVCVSETSLNAVIGTQSTDDHDGTGTGIADCVPPAAGDECDFHNQRGSLFWQKRAKDATVTDTAVPLCPDSTATRCPLFGGATFRVTPDPTGGGNTCGAGTTEDPTVTNCLQVTDNAGLDVDPTAGEICLDSVALNPSPATAYTITEFSSNNVNYAKDTTSKTDVRVTSSGTCGGTPSTDAGDFINTPLSVIRVTFGSLADGGLGNQGVTKSTIECTGQLRDSSQTPPGDDVGDSTPTTFDDVEEIFTALVPGTYTCTIVVDP